ncbi:MAG TPA: ATP-binding protein [Candidatus Hydrogenedentes bacterium]|nr:ATP-binding protein [Candidatus Hydrogenedentota bacterium]
MPVRPIPPEQIVQRVQSENPWWNDPQNMPFSELTPRGYLASFQQLIAESTVRRALVLMGPRRVGKTVLIHHVIHHLISSGVSPASVCYISIDNPLYIGLGLEELLDIYQNASGIDYTSTPCYVFFDEIQYLKDWERHLKVIVDRYPNLKCIVSGSAAAALRLKSLESGAGRFTDFFLPPLTFYEYMRLINSDVTNLLETLESHPNNFFSYIDIQENIETLNTHFVEYLNFGGYPEAALSAEIQTDPGRFIKNDIIDKVLLRDLPSLYGIHDVQELNALFTSLAYNTAQEITLEKLSQGSGIAKNTIKRYIEYLEAAFLIRIVHRVDQNARHFKRANFFKVYLTNPSMWTALFTQVNEDMSIIGSLVETAIFAQRFHVEKDYYARWSSGEVDMVLMDDTNRPKYVTEIKWSDRIVEHPEELKALLDFCHKHSIPVAFVTTRTHKVTIVRENISIGFFPAAALCLLFGKFSLDVRAQKEKLRLSEILSCQK